jgi:hypothetical protein
MKYLGKVQPFSMKKNVLEHAHKSLWKLKMYTATMFKTNNAWQIFQENHKLLKRDVNSWLKSQCKNSSRCQKTANHSWLTQVVGLIHVRMCQDFYLRKSAANCTSQHIHVVSSQKWKHTQK